jgi:hypothetical protein
MITAIRMTMKSRFRTTRRLTSTTRQAPRKNRRTGPGFEEDMEGACGERRLA